MAVFKLSKESIAKVSHLFNYFYEERFDPYLAFHESTRSKYEVAEAIRIMLQNFFPPDKETLSILDIGSGGGELAYFLLEELKHANPTLRVSYCATDPSSKALDYARRKLNAFPEVRYMQIGVGKIPQPSHRLKESLEEERFDFLLASYVMFWIDDWESALDEFLECVRPGGLICIILSARKRLGEKEGFRPRLLEIAHDDSEFPEHFFAEDFEVLLYQKGIQYQTQPIHSVIRLNPKNITKFNDEMEFLITRPLTELTEGQIKEIKNHILDSSISNALHGCQEIIWIGG